MPSNLGIVASGAPNGDAFAEVPGSSASLWVPDAAGIDFTADLDLRIELRMSNWDGSYVLYNKFGSDGNASYRLRVLSGIMQLSWTPTGLFAGVVDVADWAAPLLATRFSANTKGFLRATLDADNGAAGKTVQFFTSADGSSWTQIGSTQTSAGTTSVYNSTQRLDFAQNLGGKVYSAWASGTIGGSAALDYDLTRDGRSGSTTTALTGQTVTYSGSITYGND